MKDKNGFTLAEVLITLAVIGVVAALTIPLLINASFEKQAVSQAKENYSILTQAISKYQSDRGCEADIQVCFSSSGYSAYLRAQFVNDLLPYLKVQESKCYANAATISALPWLPDQVTSLSAETGVPTFLDKTNDYSGACVVLLQNSTTFTLTQDLWGGTLMAFDINAQKKPNRIGKDVFLFSLFTPTKNAINPYYTNNWGAWCSASPIAGLCNACSRTCPDDGHSPLAYVLTHDKLPDLKSMGYPTTP